MSMDIDTSMDDDGFECTGLRYRARVTKFATKYGIALKMEMNLLKRASCGCDTCLWIEEQVREMDVDVFGLLDCEDGKIYTVSTQTEKEWQTGYEYVTRYIFTAV